MLRWVLNGVSFSFFILSCFAAQAQDYRAYVTQRNAINSHGSIAAINHFHQELTRTPSEYLIVDKMDNTLLIFTASGDLSSIKKVTTYRGDELESGGSGIYYYAGVQNGVHYGRAEKDQSMRPLFKADLHFNTNIPVYILPREEKKHRFRIWNGGLIYNAHQVFRNRPEMNYSPRNYQFISSRIQTDFEDHFSRAYVQALESEKANLMALLELDNDEYNMLAELSFGILAPETNFGSSVKYRIKQALPLVVSTLKGNGFDTSQNSQGPTQIKNIPEVIGEHYDIEKRDLGNPHNAAIATLGFVALQLRELRNMAFYMEEITEENLQDYMYYLYNGRRFEIRSQTATPDLNSSIQLIKKAIHHIHIVDSP